MTLVYVKLSSLGFFFSFFFVCAYFRQASAETAAPILTLNSQMASFRARMCFLGVLLMMLPIYGVKSPKNRSKRGVKRQLPAKSRKSLNFDIIKTTEPISTTFCTMIKTTKSTSWVVPRMRTTNPIGGRPPYSKY